jgi:DNA-binding HxlR family transcriptional regulator
MDTAPRTPETFQACQHEMTPVTDVLQQIGGKWTVYIIGQLSQGPRRFSKLKRAIEGVSQKVLTATLRELEKDGLVTRTVTPSIPPRVDYELTEMGRELREPLHAIGQWAHANRDRVDAARKLYEAAYEQAGPAVR